MAFFSMDFGRMFVGKVKRGVVHHDIVVRAAMPHGRCDGTEVKFDDNAVVG